MTPYLEFVELSDYLAHLKERMEHTTRLEITSTAGERGNHGLRGITYHAVASARFSDYIAVCAVPIFHTTNFHLQASAERDETRGKVHANFDKVRAEIEQLGVHVARGKWMYEAPAYLREG